jgi:hypothetical protein
MLYQKIDGKIRTLALEFSAADHCNLRCAGCSHMSPFMEARAPEVEQLDRDLRRLATVMVADEIRALGGEPLLNPQLADLLAVARQSGVARRVVLTTNGLLLNRMADRLWAAVDEVRISLYPGARPKESLLEEARARAREHHVTLLIHQHAMFRVSMTTQAHPADWITGMIYKTCQNAHRFHCHLVERGFLFKCACPAYLPRYLARVGGVNGAGATGGDSGGMSGRRDACPTNSGGGGSGGSGASGGGENGNGSVQSGAYDPRTDGFDLHGPGDLAAGLWNYLNRANALQACRHCLGYMGKKQPHRQLTMEQTRNPAADPITRKSHLSVRRLVKESAKYWGRRTGERWLGKRYW